MEEEPKISTKIDLEYAEHLILFLICDCSLDRDFSFYKLSREEAKELIDCLKHKENLTWKQFANIPRGNGLTCEIPNTKSFNLIHEQNSSIAKFTEKYYFHFRTKHNGLFRIFGYQRKQFFCITHLDRKGILHH